MVAARRATPTIRFSLWRYGDERSETPGASELRKRWKVELRDFHVGSRAPRFRRRTPPRPWPASRPGVASDAASGPGRPDAIGSARFGGSRSLHRVEVAGTHAECRPPHPHSG